MSHSYSLQDTLERLWRGRKREADRAERRAARERALDYRAGRAMVDRLIGRIWSSCGSAGKAVWSLRHAIRQHGYGLAGRVTRAELSKAVMHYERENERQRPQREADASLIELWQRSARDHADWQSVANRGWYARRYDAIERSAGVVDAGAVSHDQSDHAPSR